MERDDETPGRGDEPTGRTRMAQDAINEAFRAQSGVVEVKRAIKRAKGVWGTLTFLALVGGAGFGLATYLGQFETREKAKTQSIRLDDVERHMSAIDAENRAINNRLDRIETKLDRLFEKLMRGR